MAAAERLRLRERRVDADAGPLPLPRDHRRDGTFRAREDQRGGELHLSPHLLREHRVAAAAVVRQDPPAAAHVPAQAARYVQGKMRSVIAAASFFR